MKDSAFTRRVSVLLKQPKFFPNTYDFLAFLFILSIFAAISVGVHEANQSLQDLRSTPISLSVINLPKYALFTTLRIFAAIILSLISTFLLATLAAKNRRMQMIIIPLVDIMQSVPILGFLAFSVSFFIGIFPGHAYGAELAAIFTVFTAQVWNMIFSLYQSLLTVPQDLKDVSGQFCLGPWQKFWRLEVPCAIPGLVWNTMLSISSSWFFIVAAEAISVGNINIALPGIGSWLSLAIKNKDIAAVGSAILTMAIVIFVYDQLIFRPIVAWADKFNMGQTASQDAPKSLVYEVLRRTRLLNIILRPLRRIGYKILTWHVSSVPYTSTVKINHLTFWYRLFHILWYGILMLSICACMFFLGKFLHPVLSIANITVIFILGIITFLRVFILVLISSFIWVPIGVWVGLRPQFTAFVQPAAQFLAAFPANILFPFFVIIIINYDLNPNTWLSPLMILGTQWYIFFNVMAGVSAIPNDLKEAAQAYHVRKFIWCRKIIIPAILPYYVTGAVTAAGGAWNASIVAEYINWGKTTLVAQGIGSYIAKATKSGDLQHVVLGVATMCVFIIIVNKMFWRKFYQYAIKLNGVLEKNAEIT